jgi:small GTP-binding protein
MLAERKISLLKKRFQTEGEGHIIFARHAAFPIVFTPDLLSCLWLNFNTYYEHNNSSNIHYIHHTAVSDFLLSNLCHEIGFELYEMDKEIRNVLLNELRTDKRFGQQRITMLASFLYQYAETHYRSSSEQHFKEMHHWTALTIAQPQQAVIQIGEALSQAVEKKKTGKLLSLYMLLDTFVREDKAFEQLFEFSKGIKEHIYGNKDYIVKMPVLTTTPDDHSINLLKLPIPESLRGKIKKNLSYLDSDIARKIREAKESDLTILDLSNMQLNTIPNEVFDLQQLQILNLSNNGFTVFPFEISQLANLNQLNLKNNQLSNLTKEITDLNLEIKWEDDGQGGIILEGNPLEYPPIEIIQHGREAVQSYFESLNAKTRTLNEVRVFLVGDGGAGKTSLVQRLLNDNFNFDSNELTTRGIKITDLIVKEGEENILVHFWDIGGQDIYFATYQFFLSKRSIYILVIDGRKEGEVEEWLKIIQSFGGDSPVLIVLNKMDENPSFDLTRKFLKQKFNMIKGFYPVSCKNNTGIKEFFENLKKELLNIQSMQTVWPAQWFGIKTELEKITNNFINREEYRRICLKYNIEEYTDQQTLIQFLNNLGVVLHFKDFELADTIVLNPTWIIEAVYRIINSEELAKNYGILKIALLDKIFTQKAKTDYYYPPERYFYIIALMKKFELCYSIDQSTILIPVLLEIQEPEFEFDLTNSLKVIFDYDFLPKSIIPRFIVRMHKDIKESLLWRSGVVLENMEFASSAVIKADERDRKISIHVNGERKREYLGVIRETLITINQRFENLKVREEMQSNNFRIFLASSGDVPEERAHVRSLIEGIGKERAFRDRINLQCIAWDQPGVAVPMEAPLTPQEAISQGMPKPSDCDLVIVILWSRIGTPLPSDYRKPDGSRYLSGTDWEYHDAVTAFNNQGRPQIWLYRRNQIPAPPFDDPDYEEKKEQWGLVNTFFKSLINKDGSIAGSVNEYSTPGEFRKLFGQHLRDILTKKADKFRHGEKAVKPESKQKTDIYHLPRPSTPLVGRAEELKKIEAAFNDYNTHIFAIIAAGGIGKSALVDEWLSRLKTKNSKLKTIFGWSFYSQGTHDTQTSSGQFFENALPFFGPSLKKVSEKQPLTDDTAKGRQLAELLREKPSLLILDGVEPLQNKTLVDGGRFKDVGLAALLRDVERNGLGENSLLIISSRQPLKELQNSPNYQALDLQSLRTEDGIALLKSLKVQGLQNELERVVKIYGGHALALVLLGNLLTDFFGGDVNQHVQLPALLKSPHSKARANVHHVERLMTFYSEYWGDDAPERCFLSLLGLLNRPMDEAEKESLIENAEIARPLAALSAMDWHGILNNLQEMGLLLEKDKNSYDTHPLIRSYFGEQFQNQNPSEWKQAHLVLFEYFQRVPKKLQPDTLEELEPLYRAVEHGCLAGEYKKTMEDVYRDRIKRGNEHYSTQKLGAYAQDLTAIAAFFPQGWGRPVSKGLSEAHQGWLLADASFCLMSLGRLSEALEPKMASIKLAEKLKEWITAAIYTENLVDSLLPLGQLKKAQHAAEQTIDFADRTDDQHHQMASRTRLGTSLHRQGDLEAALRQFKEAERMQEERQPEYPLLYSLPGAWYCALLLALSKDRAAQEAVLERGQYALEIAMKNNWLLDIAFDHLTIARALFSLQRFDQAKDEFDQAVSGGRKAGRIDHFPEFLLKRAKFHCQQKDFKQSQADLDEAQEIIVRCGMKLYAADAALLQGNLNLDQDKPAHSEYQMAKKLIEETGYHLRDGALQVLMERLAVF